MSIVINYLEPLCLKNFFVDSGLNVQMKFDYDGRNYKVTCDELSVILDMFPNMVVMGITLDEINVLDNL